MGRMASPVGACKWRDGEEKEEEEGGVERKKKEVRREEDDMEKRREGKEGGGGRVKELIDLIMVLTNPQRVLS